MSLARLPALRDFISDNLHAADEDVCAYAQNFYLEERAPDAGVQLYAGRLGAAPVADVDDWLSRHEDYVWTEINVPHTSWPFRAENQANRLGMIDKRLYLVRVEPADWPCKEAGISPEQLRDHLDKYRQGDKNAETALENFCDIWNQKRNDSRPMFATTELEVEDILQHAGNDWAEQLRDRLGLGHYSVMPDQTVNILLTRYTVAEVFAANPDNGAPAVPTLLDSGMSHYFHPSPIPAPGACPEPCMGATVNLQPVQAEGDYQFGCELIHPRLDYRPEHLYRMGVIANPVTMPLERARRFHLPWLQAASGRNDYGHDL